MSKKHKKVCRILNYIEHFLILASTIAGCVFIDILIGITSSAIRLKIFAITAGIKKYKSIIKKACFQHDIAYGDFKDLTGRTAFDKILLDKAFDIAKNPKYDGYQRGLASMVYIFLDKKTSGGAATLALSETLATQNKSAIKNENISKKELAEELQKPVIKKFKKRKAQSTFIDNIWGADLADIQLISKFNKGFCFLLCVMIFSLNTHGLFL